jgi:hypothetical protein
VKPILAIDYDDTYTREPNIFEAIRILFQRRGYLVYIVTARPPTKPIEQQCLKFDSIIYTAGKAKASVVRASIWMDDNALTLCCDLKTHTDGMDALEHNSTVYMQPSTNLYQNYNGEHWKWHWINTYFTPQKESTHD